ncbi:hypothetical protein [Flavobacterium filum]|uniref:hypothetical protein n=1 Tax=Flavobacterium filum TaxID=370974 RepID=UPI0023F07EEE|nr:hypothetical protein [Flavobacterium filum]
MKTIKFNKQEVDLLNIIFNADAASNIGFQNTYLSGLEDKEIEYYFGKNFNRVCEIERSIANKLRE